MAERLPLPPEPVHPAFGSTDYIRLQQELIAVRTRLDRQIAQLTRLNRLSNTLLSQQLGGEGLEAFAETIPDVLDMAIGVVWELEGHAVRDMAAFGLELNDPQWRALGLELMDRLESGGRRQAVRLDAASEPLLANHQLCDVLICRCMNSEGQCIGVVMAANTVTLAGMFDPISDESLTVLTQVSERFAAHLDNRRYHELLDQRLQQLKESEERLQRVLQGTNDGWWDWDLRSDQCLVSRRWIEMLDGSAHEPRLLQGFWLDRVHPADRDAFEHSLRQTLNNAGEATLEREVDLVQANGQTLPVLVRGTASRGPDGAAIRFSGTILDLTERKRHEAHVHRLAFYDALTDLPNRRGLMEALPRTIAACQAAGQRLALLMIDLDGFKKLNDTHGHAAGDQMLHVVGQRLRQGVRSHDLVARLGGDEFVVLLDGMGTELETAQIAAQTVAQGLLQRLNRPYELEVGISHHSASIGVAVLDRRSPTAEDLMQHADVALYEAKGSGRAQVRIFDPDMQLQVNQRAQLELQLRNALEQEELALHFHGIVDTEGRLRGAEALLRWPRQGRAWVPPDRFIPVAEESGLIHLLGDWSLRQVAAVLHSWQGMMPPDFRISLNLSSSQFLHPDFVERILERMAACGMSSDRLKLEITEATVLDDLSKAAERMNRLREHGVLFSLDDFGTGYSSISYLRQLPLAEVKIDKSYVRDFLHNRSDAAVMRAVLSLCQSLEMSVVAEGIETEEQWRQLRADGCDRFQGFLFSRPREPGTEPDSLLRSRWRAPELEFRPPA
ncbi:MAG: putative bifunctional diguanylate cyclase/phosphodiesterase [Vulcanococcus sp.]